MNQRKTGAVLTGVGQTILNTVQVVQQSQELDLKKQELERKRKQMEIEALQDQFTRENLALGKLDELADQASTFADKSQRRAWFELPRNKKTLQNIASLSGMDPEEVVFLANDKTNLFTAQKEKYAKQFEVFAKKATTPEDQLKLQSLADMARGAESKKQLEDVWGKVGSSISSLKSSTEDNPKPLSSDERKYFTDLTYQSMGVAPSLAKNINLPPNQKRVLNRTLQKLDELTTSQKGPRQAFYTQAFSEAQEEGKLDLQILTATQRNKDISSKILTKLGMDDVNQILDLSSEEKKQILDAIAEETKKPKTGR